MNGESFDADVGHLLRDLAPQVLAAVVRRHDDFSGAEDAVQEALIAAAAQWPQQGTPDNPRGWLYQVATRRMIDYARAEVARRRREDAVAVESAIDAVVPSFFSGIDDDEDDTLPLLFMCCHPSLSPPSAIALTLRAVGGLTTAEIARAFLVPEATMAQRISRAKQTIRNSNVAFHMPTDAERAERLGAVLHVLYLVFSEGYSSSTGDDLHRTDLSNEAIRLTRMLRHLQPGSGAVAGLLALMLLTDARRAARTGANGELITLDEQDRSRWDQGMIAEGVALVAVALSSGPVGAYPLQAAIAALHDEAPRVEDTDWPQILALYDALALLSDNPVVLLNRAVAAAMVHGPDRGLVMLEPLDADPRMQEHYRLEAVRAHLYEMAGDRARAVELYRRAADRTASMPERDYLRGKAARLASAVPGAGDPQR